MGVEPIYIDSHISLLPTSPANGPFWMEVNINFLRFAEDEHFLVPAKYLRKKTLIEMFGKEELNKQLVGKSEYYNQELLGDSYYEMLDDVTDKSKLDE